MWHETFGVSAREPGWVPAPRYLLRGDRILRLMRGRPPGEVLEIGCGSGALLYDMVQLGHRCVALESSDAAVERARHLNRGRTARIVEGPEESWSGRFDYIL